MTPDQADAAKHAADVLSIGVAVATIAQILPSIAALLSIVWLCIQIGQSQRYAQLTGFIGQTWRRWRGR